jgi:predicted nucleic acid-binding Zn ribbon protein
VDNYTNATGHKAVTDAAVAATCTKTGLTAGSHCSVCGVTIKAQETVPATGHNWDKGTVTKPATEEAEGVMTYKCISCGETKTATIPMLSHTHKYEKVVTNPTCTEQGYSTYTCKCGHTYVDNYVKATGHKAENDKAVAATCTKTGLTAGSHCSVCGVVIKAQEIVPATSHNWDKGTVTKPATEDTEGIMTYKCSSCGETKTSAIPVLSHTHKYEKIVTKPTCTEQGYSTYTCKCGHTYVDNYTNATGHKAVTDAAVAATCTKTGLTAGSHCSVCGLTIKAQKTVPATGHNWDKGTVTKTATEETEGIMTYKCSSCGETKTASIPVLSQTHKY